MSLSLGRGSITALLGPSGAGKSTLLALTAGFLTPRSGEVYVEGQPVTSLPPSRRPITTLFQEHNLFSHLTAIRNVALGLDPRLRMSASLSRKSGKALARVGLEGKENRLPRELSGGERQRVALARALLMRRSVLLLDEPFVALGPAMRRDMLDLVASLGAENGMTIIIVSHEPDDARRIASQSAFLADGKVIAFGPTGAILDRPNQPEIARYLGVSVTT